MAPRSDTFASQDLVTTTRIGIIDRALQHDAVDGSPKCQHTFAR